MQALLQLPNGQAIPIQLPGSIVAQPQTQMVSVQTVSPPKNTTAITKKTIPRIVQGNTQFVQTVPNIVQQRPVMQGVVQSVSGAVHNLPVGIVQNPVTRPVPLQTVKLGPSPLTQTVALQQTGNHSVFATVISPNNQTVTQTNTVIAPQFVVQSAQKKPAVSPKLQAQSTSKTSPNQGSQPYTKQVILQFAQNDGMSVSTFEMHLDRLLGYSSFTTNGVEKADTMKGTENKE